MPSSDEQPHHLLPTHEQRIALCPLTNSHITFCPAVAIKRLSSQYGAESVYYHMSQLSCKDFQRL